MMETMLSETPALCSKTADSSKKNTESPKVSGVIWKYTIAISPVGKEAKDLFENSGEGNERQSQEECNMYQSVNLILFAQEQKQILSNPKSISSTAASTGDQAERPPLVKQVFLNVSINRLLYCLSSFLCRRCFQLKDVLLFEPVRWLRVVDNALMRCGWQDLNGFISLQSLVFLYMMCRSVITFKIKSKYKLRKELYSCLYLTYTYLGGEITYPMYPFLLYQKRDEFCYRCLEIIQCTSADMLKLNADPQYFTQIFQDLLIESQ